MNEKVILQLNFVKKNLRQNSIHIPKLFEVKKRELSPSLVNESFIYAIQSSAL